MQCFARGLAAALLVSLALVARAEISDEIDAPVAEIRGQASEITPGVVTFLGVPYAEPPVEENRWRPPELIVDGKRIRAEAFGAQCIQQAANSGGSFAVPGRGFAGQFGGGFGGGGMRGGGGGMRGGGAGMGRGGFGAVVQSSEDCLFLNIWSGAERENAGAPVMVWVPGEFFERGASSDPRFNGETLASRGVVVIDFNYRVGALGFLAHPDLTAESGTSGNYGLMDAIAALKWIKRNVEAFGGDPDNITLFGSSSGASMIAALIASPEAEGLFRKAILQSGSWMGTGIRKMPTLAEAEQAGARLMSSRFPEMDLDDLKDLPPGQLTTVMPEPQLIVDGRYVTDDLSNVFASGDQPGISVLVGSNREEGVTFVQRAAAQTAEQYEAAVRERLGSLADEYLRIYPSGTTLGDASTANRVALASSVTALGDELAWAMRRMAFDQIAVGASAYVYEFTRVPPPANQLDDPASVHGAEIPYVFNNMAQNRQWTDGDRQLAQVMASYWINFAETGSPNGKHRWQDATLPPWPTYTGADEFQTMEFGDRVGTNPIWQISPEKMALFNRIHASLVLN